jgi:uncharacterized protein (DUF1800 family)
MQKNVLWSLRLGFSAQQSVQIQKLGFNAFISQSFSSSNAPKMPAFLKDEPHTLADLKNLRQEIKNADEKEQKKILKKQIYNHFQLKKWWLQSIRTSEWPLREKMVVFWHNHFVSSAQKVKVNYWIYQHYTVLNENAFGNFKELTKKIIQTNAMVKYLDNVDNKKDNLNENLSRELLELFTLGIGNYTELDVKNGAKALAGLNLGEDKAMYRKPLEVNETIEYLGKKGHFKVEELIDQIFEQPQIPYLITRKILQWFLYDQPDEKLVQYYGDFFRTQNFEIKPLLLKMFTEEYEKDIQGHKIKDPLVYILQLANELQLQPVSDEAILWFLRQQGMDLFNPPNVKGWEGGNSWLTSQTYLQRNKASDLWCQGKNLKFKNLKDSLEDIEIDVETVNVQLNWNKKSKPNTIIQSFTDRLLFQVDENMQQDLEQMLKYDFDPYSPNANDVVMRMFHFITQTPEFQIL